MPRVVAQDMPARLAAAAAAVTDTGKAHRLALKHRRELIFEAVDTEGMHQREVARWPASRSPGSAAILARPDEDERRRDVTLRPAGGALRAGRLPAPLRPARARRRELHVLVPAQRRALRVPRLPVGALDRRPGAAATQPT
jgi:hypothetical protein